MSFAKCDENWECKGNENSLNLAFVGNPSAVILADSLVIVNSVSYCWRHHGRLPGYAKGFTAFACQAAWL